MTQLDVTALIEFTALDSGDIVTVLSVLVAAAGVIVTVRTATKQLAAQAQTATGQFLLDLDALFKEHDGVHRKLRGMPPDQRWWQGDHPSGVEWASVEAYMGLFERIWILIDHGSVDAAVIERLYGYRLANIVSNDEIRNRKLLDPKIARYWLDFIALWRALDREHEARFRSPLSAKHPAPSPPYPFNDKPGAASEP